MDPEKGTAKVEETLLKNGLRGLFCKRMNILFSIAVFLGLFINSSFGTYLGIDQLLLGSMSVMVVYFLLLYAKGNISFSDYNNSDAVKILYVGIFIFAVKYFFDQDFFKDCLSFFVLPMVVSMVLEQMDVGQRTILRRLLLLFFVVECGMSIYEKLTLTHVFQLNISESEWGILNRESWSFRSEALLGHPLLNAQVVSIIMVFIVLSESFPVIVRFVLIALGFVALLCFNARGAIIVTTLVVFPYMFKITRTQSKKIRDIFSIIFITSLVFFIYYVSQNDALGGRLFRGSELMDGSAQTRLDAFNFYRYLTSQDLYVGSENNYLYLTKKLGAGGVENGLIVLIIKYGLVLTLLSFPLLVKFHYNKLRICYSKMERWMILIVFYIIGIMNPNLSMATIWVFWLFSYYAFRPLNVLFQQRGRFV